MHVYLCVGVCECVRYIYIEVDSLEVVCWELPSPLTMVVRVCVVVVAPVGLLPARFNSLLSDMFISLRSF